MKHLFPLNACTYPRKGFRSCRRLLRNSGCWNTVESVCDTNLFISLFERDFKMMKQGVCFIVIALLVVDLLKIFVYAN